MSNESVYDLRRRAKRAGFELVTREYLEDQARQQRRKDTRIEELREEVRALKRNHDRWWRFW